MKHSIRIFLVVLFFFQNIFTQSIHTKYPITNGTVYSIAQSGNSIYIGGTFTYVGPLNGNGGVVDTNTGAYVSSFPKVNAPIQSVVADGNGGWFIGGDFTQVGGVSRNHLAHIQSDKSLDASWNPNVNSVVYTMELVGTKLYFGGAFSSVGGNARNNLAAVDANSGALDGWNPNANNSVLVMKASGNMLYIGGTFTAVLSTSRNHVAAIDATTGALDAQWNPDANNYVQAIAIGNSKIYLGGNFTSVGSVERNRLAAVNTTTGALDNWNPHPNSVIYSLATYGNNVFVAGEFDTIGGTKRNYLALTDTLNGTVNAFWNPNPNNSVFAISLYGGKVFVGGDFTTIKNTARSKIAALEFGNDLNSWEAGANGSVYAIAGSENNIYIGGNNSSVGGHARNRSASFDATTGEISSWNPNANNLVFSIALSGNKAYIGGAFTTLSGTTRNRIAAVDAVTGALDGSFNPNANNWIRSIVISGTKIFLGGNFTTIAGTSRNYAAAVHSTSGSLDASWNPNANNIIRSMAIWGSKMYLGGEFTTMGGTSRNHLAAVNTSSGALDNSFNPNANDNVFHVFAESNKIYFGGDFTTIGNTSRNYIAQVDATSGALSSWNPNANARVNVVVKKGNKVYAGGDFTSIGGESKTAFAALDTSSGNADAGWNISPNENSDGTSILVASGKTFLGGTFDTLSSAFHPRFVAIDPAGPSLTLSQTSIDFGNVQVNSSRSDTLIVTNNGTETLTISSIISNNAMFTVSPPNGNIASSATMEFYITFTPSTNGNANGTITLSHNGFGNSSTISVSGTGEYSGFSADPSSLSFGYVLSGNSSTDNIIVTNTDAVALNITNVVSSNGEFSVTPTKGNIAASDSMKFYITFSPTSTGTKSGTISFTHNLQGSPGTVNVSGTGTAPGFSLSPTTIAFGEVVVGSTEQEIITVSNTGNASFDVTSATSTHGEFSVSPSSATVAPLSSQTFTVTFAPISTGNKSGAIVFVHTGIGSPDSVSVSGTGIGSKKFRTFNVATELSLKENKLKQSSGQTAKLPNAGNWRDTVLARAAGTKGVVVGIEQTSILDKKLYGWMRLKKGSSATGKYFATIQTDCTFNAPFDSIRKIGSSIKKVFVKELKPTSSTYYNPLAQEFSVFKLNLLSSRKNITPSGMDSLVYVNENSVWNGMSLSQISNNIDSVLTYYKTNKLPGNVTAARNIPALEDVRDMLQSINNAFYKTIALANGDSVIPNVGLRFGGGVELDSVPFLEQSSKAIVEELNGTENDNTNLSQFSLEQNYPNPFNPKTTIHYTLSTAALVTLKVYDVLGREIATLFNNENKDAGKFEVQFDASNVSSGIYFYRLSVTQLGKLRYTETKKFVVMK